MLPPRLAAYVDEEDISRIVKEKCSMNIHFYANACHVCRKFGDTVELKRCASCKMISYCSLEHQKEHWPKHKQICLIIGKMNKESGFILDWKTKRISYAETWYEFRVRLLNEIRPKLGRKILFDEMEMIVFPRACLFCHETDARKLINCPKCPVTTFCIEHIHNQSHQKRCEISQVCFELDTVPCFMLEFSPHTNIGVKLPEDMEAVIKLYKTFYRLDDTDPPLKRGLIYFSDLITRPYSTLFVLKKLSFKRPRMNLHLVGADLMDTRSVQYWEVVLHHMESLKHLDITLIGPNLQTQNSFNVKLCDRCEARKATILIKVFGKLYHDYVNSDEYTEPNIIGSFSIGMCDLSELRQTWPLGIKEVEKQCYPFFFTSYSYGELKNEEAVIDKTIGKKVDTLYSGDNPFASLRPGMNFYSEDFFYCNGYITVYEKL